MSYYSTKLSSNDVVTLMLEFKTKKTMPLGLASTYKKQTISIIKAGGTIIIAIYAMHRVI